MLRSLPWKTYAVVAASCLLAAYCQVLADAIWRVDYSTPLSLHWWGAFCLYSSVGGALGALACVIVAIERGLVARLGAWFSASWRPWVAPAYFGLVGALLSFSVAYWTFSGKGISETIWATLGPPLFLLLVFVGIGLWSRWLLWVGWHSEQQRHRRLFIAVALAISIVLTLVDRYVFVSLYDRLHAFLEAAVLVVLASVCGLLLNMVIEKRQRLAVGAGVVAVSGAFAALLFVTSGAARESVDRSLTHAWVDPVYAGRMLRRLEELETYLKDPRAYDGINMQRLDRLRERYHLKDVSLANAWVAPPAPAAASATRQRLADNGLRSPNILVFYIDTLRNDVARDSSIMPNLAKFASQSLDFRRAYATGSDTLRSLPGITGGSYFVRHTHGGDLCNLARRSNYDSSLYIAKSARQFLEQLRPSFAFEHEVQVGDYAEGRDVWGYGADGATAEKIVDSALAHLREHKNDKFFMWLFNFDQHNWRELSDDYVAQVKTKYNVPAEGTYNSRYRAIATAIDAQFGRLLHGLDDLGLTDDTVVLLVSDHGEGLGDGGFWVHSVFLWESLIHVPLLLRVPGVEPRVVDRVVSLVDIAPTLAPFLVPGAPLQGYHGEDLLLHADGKAPPRRFPVLFAAALRDELVRIGMVDDAGDLKLVVRLEAAQLEMHDLNGPNPDDSNVVSRQPERGQAMLRRLAKSPSFPREPDDFRMLKPKGSISLEASSETLPVSAGY